jgi:N-acetylneuraminic acid mutarotase
MVQLDDGKVYAFGGYSGGTAYKNLYIFNPSTNSWSAGADMNVLRAGAMGGKLSDGRLMVTGGFNFGSGPVKTTEVYNPSTNTWTNTANMLHNRAYGMATTMKDGRYLVIGGVQNTSWLPSNSVQYYNEQTNTFVSLANLNRARYTTSRPLEIIVLGNGKIVFGAAQGESGANTNLEIYDPVANSWTDIAVPSGLSVSNAILGVDDNRFMLINGTNSKIYNTTTGEWSALEKDLPTHQHTSLKDYRLGNGQILYYGGSNALGSQKTSLFDPVNGTIAAGPELPVSPSGSLWIDGLHGFAPMMIGATNGDESDYRVDQFKEKTLEWENLASTNQRRCSSSQGLRLKNGNIVVVAGYDDEWYLSRTAEYYDYAAKTWIELPDYGNQRRDVGKLSELPNGNVIYVGGYHYYDGYDPDTDEYIWEEYIFNTTRILDMKTKTWSDGPALNTPRYNHIQVVLPNGHILVVGGYDDNWNTLSSAEILNTETMQWEVVADAGYYVYSTQMHEVLFDGRLVIWGADSNREKAIAYDPIANSWKEIAHPSRQSGQITHLENGRYLIFGGVNKSNKPAYGWDIFEPYTPKKIPLDFKRVARLSDKLAWMLPDNTLLPKTTEAREVLFENSRREARHSVLMSIAE